MAEFFTKYPDADPNRFVFKDGKVWFKLNPDNEYRLLDIESDTYQRTPSWTKYLTSYKECGFGIWFADGTVQPYKKNTTMKEINKFKVYVTEDKYFVAEHFLSRIHHPRITKRTPISSLLSPCTCQPTFAE